MAFSTTDRNRLTVAVVATVVLASVGFMASGRAQDAAPDSTVATTTSLDTGLSTDNTADAPANLDGPVSKDPNGSGQVAYPSENDGQMARGTATFKRLPNDARTGCTTSLAPLGATVTVRNLNNGHKTTCTNINLGIGTGSADIILHTTLFAAIAELMDAPIPVELTW